MATNDIEHNDQRLVTQRQYWRRVDQPVLSWWPGGLLPLLGLAVLFVWGLFRTVPHIQADVRDAVTDNLRESNIEVLEIDASGQAVKLLAQASPDAERSIRSIAKVTECDTWAGRLTCPTQVQLALTAPPVPEPVPEPVSESIPIPVQTRFHDFVATKFAGGLTLSGEVSDASAQRSVAKWAGERFSAVDVEVDVSLDVSNEAATPQYGNAVNRALDVLQQLEQGEARWRNGELDITGIVSSTNESAARSAFSLSDNAPSLGTLTLELAKGASVCNESFDEVLRSSTINFGSGSAAMADGSESLLEDLAGLALQCPGLLSIEGHTDNVGSTEFNRALSQQRADAVAQKLIDLGVPGSALKTQGFGPGQPIADNATAAGRAANRRIVVRVVE